MRKINQGCFSKGTTVHKISLVTNKVDGANDTPFERPEKREEVEGREMEEEERSMMGWVQVRRKSDQEEMKEIQCCDISC